MNDHSSNSNNIGPCDWSRLLSVTSGNDSIAATITKTFVNEIPVRLAEIESAIQARDGVALHRGAHTLKSSLRMFGADAAVDLVLSLEQAGKSNSFDDAPSQAAELKDELTRIETAINERWHSR